MPASQLCVRAWQALFGIAFLLVAHRAAALPLSPFQYEIQAQRHCPDDVVVWLDFSKRRYYEKTQKRYGLGRTGSFVCRDEARASGFRRSLLGLR